MDYEDTLLNILLALLISVVVILIGALIMANVDYNEKLNEDIEDTVTGTEGGVEYHVSTAGLHREDDLLQYISNNNGVVITISYSAKGHEETTTVTISWSKAA